MARERFRSDRLPRIDSKLLRWASFVTGLEGTIWHHSPQSTPFHHNQRLAVITTENSESTPQVQHQFVRPNVGTFKLTKTETPGTTFHFFAPSENPHQPIPVEIRANKPAHSSALSQELLKALHLENPDHVTNITATTLNTFIVSYQNGKHQRSLQLTDAEGEVLDELGLLSFGAQSEETLIESNYVLTYGNFKSFDNDDDDTLNSTYFWRVFDISNGEFTLVNRGVESSNHYVQFSIQEGVIPYQESQDFLLQVIFALMTILPAIGPALAVIKQQLIGLPYVQEEEPLPTKPRFSGEVATMIGMIAEQHGCTFDSDSGTLTVPYYEKKSHLKAMNALSDQLAETTEYRFKNGVRNPDNSITFRLKKVG